MVYVHSMEHHSATTKELLADPTTWMNLRSIKLKEARHKSSIDYMVAFIWNSRTGKLIYDERHRGLSGGGLWQSDKNGKKGLSGVTKMIYLSQLQSSLRCCLFLSKRKLYSSDLCISLYVKRKKLLGSSVWVGLCQLVGFTVGSCLGCQMEDFNWSLSTDLLLGLGGIGQGASVWRVKWKKNHSQQTVT